MQQGYTPAWSPCRLHPPGPLQKGLLLTSTAPLFPAHQVLLAHYPGEAQAAAFLERLGAHSRLQFDFLTAALRARQEIQQVRPGPGVPCLTNRHHKLT